MNKQIWVGLAEVKPQPGFEMLKEGKGAYVYTMAWAEDAVTFQCVLARCFDQLKMELVDVRQAEPWAVRSLRGDENISEFLDLQGQISEDMSKVAFGTFHAWLKDDLEKKP